MLQRNAVFARTLHSHGLTSSSTRLFFLKNKSLHTSSSLKLSTATASQPSPKRRLDPHTGRFVWYDPLTMEQVSEPPKEEKKPSPNSMKRHEYATTWKDDRYPDWIQYTELNARRPYYFNVVTGEVSWVSPDLPKDYDVFAAEIAKENNAVMRVPDKIGPPKLWKRTAATVIDLGISIGVGLSFAALAYMDLNRMTDAIPAVGFGGWASFLLRDAIIEQGTRSIGKRIMKLEVVRMDGRLPTRRHTGLRQVYLFLYPLGPALMPYIIVLPIVESGLMLFTKKQLRLGDLIAQTRVIDEQFDRKQRLEQKAEQQRLEDLKD